MLPDRRGLTLQPLVSNGVFEPGPNKLSCTVGGIEYYADLGDKGEIIFEGKTFRSPSAFSVYVKRKINPGRKADDGWTSVKYMGEVLLNFRLQLEQYLAAESAAQAQQLMPVTVVAPSAQQGGRGKRKGRPRVSVPEVSDDELAVEFNGISQHISDSDVFYEDMMDEEVVEDTHVTMTPTVDIDHTWIQCENSKCQKWRRVRYSDVPDGPWYCSSNSDGRFNICSAPQELCDEEIDRLMVEGAMARHVASSRRPPLERCSPEVFEADLVSFLEARGDEQLATFLRERRITCNNIPLDVFGLYREVIRLGGLLANERYDDRGRWAGGVNFAGDVFPRLKNWTPHNRATSVGNQLLNNYKKFLLHYERAHLPVDLPHVAKSFAVGALPYVAVPAAAQGYHRGAGSGGGGGFGGMEIDSPVSRGGGGSCVQPTDALAFLADVAGATGVDDVAPSSRGDSRAGGDGGGGGDAAMPPWGGGRSERKRRRTEDGKSTSTPYQDIWTLEDGTRVAAAGQLLLAQDPRDPGRYWAVVVADPADLPVLVAEGGVCAPISQNFPQAMEMASPTGRREDALPVLVLGTEWLGWVERRACRTYTLIAGQSAMASAWAGIESGGSGRGGRGGGGPLDGEREPLLACVRGLKEAQQYTEGRGGAGGPDTLPRTWVEAASCSHIARRLIELEGQLPPEVLSNQSHFFWSQWRKTTASTAHPVALSTQLLALAYQLLPEALRRGAGDSMWAALLGGMGMAATGPTGRSVGSLATKRRGGGGDGGLGGGEDRGLPTINNVDEAVGVVGGALDWSKIRRIWCPVGKVVKQEDGPRRRGRPTSARAGIPIFASEMALQDGLDGGDHIGGTDEDPQGRSAGVTPNGHSQPASRTRSPIPPSIPPSPQPPATSTAGPTPSPHNPDHSNPDHDQDQDQPSGDSSAVALAARDSDVDLLLQLAGPSETAGRALGVAGRITSHGGGAVAGGAAPAVSSPLSYAGAWSDHPEGKEEGGARRGVGERGT